MVYSVMLNDPRIIDQEIMLLRPEVECIIDHNKETLNHAYVKMLLKENIDGPTTIDGFTFKR